MNQKWIALAIQDGRICSKCGRPVAKKYWNYYKKHGECYQCYIAINWSKKLGAGGSSRFDNRDFEDEREVQQIY